SERTQDVGVLAKLRVSQRTVGVDEHISREERAFLVLPIGLFPDRLEFAGEDRPHAFDLFQRARGFALLARYAIQAADVLEALLHPLTPFGYSFAIRLPSSGREWAFAYVTSVHPRHAIAVSGRNACLSPWPCAARALPRCLIGTGAKVYPHPV